MEAEFAKTREHAAAEFERTRQHSSGEAEKTRQHLGGKLDGIAEKLDRIVEIAETVIEDEPWKKP